MRGKCLLISSTIIIIIFVFTLNVMSNAFAEREQALIDRNNEIIDRLMIDPNYFKGYYSAWEKTRKLIAIQKLKENNQYFEEDLKGNK